MATTGAGPWATAQERLNKFVRNDRWLVGELNDLSKDQSNDTKLAWALESGRVYGLRQQKCDMRLKRQLNRDYRRPPVEAMW